MLSSSVPASPHRPSPIVSDEEEMKVAVIGRRLFSGTMLEHGLCPTTKTLVANSSVAHMANNYGEDIDDGTRSPGLTITHDNLTRIVGSSREMVGKVMGASWDHELICSSRKKIDLLDMGALTEISESS